MLSNNPLVPIASLSIANLPVDISSKAKYRPTLGGRQAADYILEQRIEGLEGAKERQLQELQEAQEVARIQSRNAS